MAWGAAKERSLEGTAFYHSYSQSHAYQYSADLENLLTRTGAILPNEKPLSRYQELDLDNDDLDDEDDRRPTAGRKNIRGSRTNAEDDFDFDL